MSALDMVPVDLGPNAFIKIDTGSPGGRHWPGADELRFQFLGNNEFGDSVSAEYASIDIIGRSESYQSYHMTSNRDIPISLMFAAMGHGNLIDEVKKKADWCRALCYPRYVGQRMYPPPVVLLYLGKMYSASNLPVRGLIMGCEVNYCAQEAPYDPETFEPYTAQVDLQFKAVYIAGEEMLDSATIIGGKF